MQCPYRADPPSTQPRIHYPPGMTDAWSLFRPSPTLRHLRYLKKLHASTGRDSAEKLGLCNAIPNVPWHLRRTKSGFVRSNVPADRQQRTSTGAQEHSEGRVDVEMSRDKAADHLTQSELLSALSNKHCCSVPP